MRLSGQIRACLKIFYLWGRVIFTIKSLVRYKENILLNQTYLFVLRFLYFMMLAVKPCEIFATKAKYLNQLPEK